MPPCQSLPNSPHTPQQKVPGSCPGCLALDLRRCEKVEGNLHSGQNLLPCFWEPPELQTCLVLRALRAQAQPGSSNCFRGHQRDWDVESTAPVATETLSQMHGCVHQNIPIPVVPEARKQGTGRATYPLTALPASLSLLVASHPPLLLACVAPSLISTSLSCLLSFFSSEENTDPMGIKGSPDFSMPSF